MSDFDPYYKWLSIPPEEQPPTHYRLLGVQMLEQNAEVIEAAANRQMAYLQELSAGDEHIDEAQGLLGEVARARVCLLTAESKARYDAELVSTLDSLPEAEEEASAPQAEPIVNASRTPKPSSARRSSSTARRKTTSGSRGHSSGSKKSTSRKKINTGDSTKESSSLAIKIVAAVVPAVLVLIIGVILMSGGGGGKNKANNISNPETAGRSSQSDAGKGVEKDPLEAARNKNFGNQAGDNGSNRPTKPVVKPPKADSGPEKSKLNKPSEQPAAAPTEKPDDEPSEAELAEKLLEEKGLEEGINSTWKLATLTAAYEQAKNASPNSSSAAVEQEVSSRIRKEKEEIVLDARSAVAEYNNTGNLEKLKNKISRLMGIATWDDSYTIRWDFEVVHNNTRMPQVLSGPWHELNITAIPFDADEARIRQEVLATMGSPNTEANTVAENLARELANKYSELKGDEEVRQALNAVGGTLAKPPALPEATNPESTQFTSAGSPADDPSNNNSEQDDPSTGSGDKGEQKKPTKPEPTLSFAELKDQLTALEKETKLSLGAFNKGAKEYIKQKKDLVKRIKAGEALYAKRSKIQDSLPDGEQKTKFGTETDTKVKKPLQQLQAQLANLPKPDAKEIEGNLKRAKKMLEQIQGLPEYAANPKSIDSLAEKIAKYRKGFEVQQTKMAK